VQISGVRIPRNSSSILRSGNELSLGAYLLALAVDDFRWIFRQNNGNTSQNNDGSGFWEQYELGSEIGRGSFATVHRCMKRTDQSWFAVKIIHRAKWAHQPSTEKNFRREIEIMTRLDHVSPLPFSFRRVLIAVQPNIIKLQAVFETPDNYSVVMDEIKGGELLSYINDCGGLGGTSSTLSLM
jgi:ser/thr/tyr protein kinase RAD53